jgi:hypothetical protein
VANGQRVYCRHGTKLRRDPSKKEAWCGCVHGDIVERGNPHNRDPMDPSWTYEGSRLKKYLTKQGSVHQATVNMENASKGATMGRVENTGQIILRTSKTDLPPFQACEHAE